MLGRNHVSERCQKENRVITVYSVFRLYGDYETLTTGRTADALVDFTGGVAETLYLAKLNLVDFNSQVEIFTKLKEAIENRALINCNIEVSINNSFARK